jgi:hypothetical protein
MEKQTLLQELFAPQLKIGGIISKREELICVLFWKRVDL